ncbi:MAG: hypothetical protein GQ564_04760 [Bacteroidales bacterium]|nr:hypothetical protein [Bacteroidales bacterium]
MKSQISFSFLRIILCSIILILSTKLSYAQSNNDKSGKQYIHWVAQYPSQENNIKSSNFKKKINKIIFGEKSFTEDGVCGYCHTPHGKQPMAPGWNKNNPGKTYILYDNTISNTFQAIPGQPDGSSVLCLSCHDGTTALGKVTAGSMLVSYGRSSYDKSGKGNLTTDLSDDHPISFVFDASLASVDGQLKHPPLAPVTWDENEKVQCVSCHDPHNSVNPKF